METAPVDTILSNPQTNMQETRTQQTTVGMVVDALRTEFTTRNQALPENQQIVIDENEIANFTAWLGRDANAGYLRYFEEVRAPEDQGAMAADIYDYFQLESMQAVENMVNNMDNVNHHARDTVIHEPELHEAAVRFARGEDDGLMTQLMDRGIEGFTQDQVDQIVHRRDVFVNRFNADSVARAEAAQTAMRYQIDTIQKVVTDAEAIKKLPLPIRMILGNLALILVNEGIELNQTRQEIATQIFATLAEQVRISANTNQPVPTAVRQLFNFKQMHIQDDIIAAVRDADAAMVRIPQLS